MLTRNSPLVLFAGLVALGACSSKSSKTQTTATAPPPAAPAVADANSLPLESDTADADERAISLEPAYFEFDSAILTTEARSSLQNNAVWLEQHPDARLVIEGHADESGSDEYNLALGDERARAVRDYLVRLGVEASRLRAVSYGEEKPASASDASLNRRAEFVPKSDQARR